MATKNRRQFLESIGCGMLVTGLGASVAHELGFSSELAGPHFSSDDPPLTFGSPYDALVDLLQETPLEKLQPLLVEKLNRSEVSLKQLICAGALANAEAFGGEDYVGYHTAMALLPALNMVELLPAARQPLPVLKVLYRNSEQIQELGGASKKTLRELHATEDATVENRELVIRDVCRSGDIARAENLFARLASAPLDEAFNTLQPAVQDDINVHRFVFAYRTRGLAELLGKDHAHTMLRQCVRFCASQERNYTGHANSVAVLLPKLLDQYKLAAPKLGERDPGDAAVEELAKTIYNGPPDRSADAVAAALAEGIRPEVVGEAISLASNMLVLRQGPERWRTHGDSHGVHASDATNAWRNMARVLPARHAASGLIVAGYHTAAHTPFSGDFYPTTEHRATIKHTAPAALLDEAEDAVKQNDQGRAAAAIALYGEGGHPPQAVFNRMLKYAISENGRLHGEKYFQTVLEEFRDTRPAFRWRQLVALARVTASAYGYDGRDRRSGRAVGYEEACQLLKVTA